MQDAENNWQFDNFAFAEAAPGHSLSLLTWHYFKQAGLIEGWGFNGEKLWQFLESIEAGYAAANAYHNR